MATGFLLAVRAGELTYFDPLGQALLSYLAGRGRVERLGVSQLWTQLTKDAAKLYSNVGLPVQSPHSVNCGYFVLYTAYWLARGAPLTPNIVHSLSLARLSLNDQKILHFAAQRLWQEIANGYIRPRVAELRNQTAADSRYEEELRQSLECRRI